MLIASGFKFSKVYRYLQDSDSTFFDTEPAAGFFSNHLIDEYLSPVSLSQSVVMPFYHSPSLKTIFYKYSHFLELQAL